MHGRPSIHRFASVVARVVALAAVVVATVPISGCSSSQEDSDTMSYALVLNLTGFIPHTGQKIEGRVVSVADGREVARVEVIGAPEVSLDFGRVLVEGGSYRIDFYADLDMNNAYTPPADGLPMAWPDHQWRLTADSTGAGGVDGLADAAGDVLITFAHNVNWVDIDWPGGKENGGTTSY